MDIKSKIFVAGHNGLVGSAITRKLHADGYTNLLLKSSKELDLRGQKNVEDFLLYEKPDYVFMAAAKVGGIYANSTYPAEFIYDNLMIQTNIIQASYKAKVQKLLFLGSSCIYPKFSPQPIKEEYLMTGELEPTNDAYAIAKIAGIKMCQAYNRQYGTNYISVMPTNLYGPNDHFDLVNSHVLPALLRKFHEAKMNHSPSVEVWGTGSPKREFLYVDDLAEACVFLMNNDNGNQIVNIGMGRDISIKELATLIQGITGYQGNIHWNHSMPDGAPRRLLDVSRMNSLGWSARTGLTEGIAKTYQWYLAQESLRLRM